jgi:hypothetical protein
MASSSSTMPIDSLLQDWQIEKKDKVEKEVYFNIPLSKVRPLFMEYNNWLDEVMFSHTLADGYLRHISLNLPRFAKLISLKQDIDSMIAASKTKPDLEYKKHIGGNIHVTVTSKYHSVDIRQFVFIDSNLTPTRMGISLHFVEWYFLKQSYKYVLDVLPHLATIKICTDAHHVDDMAEAFSCRECFPF